MKIDTTLWKEFEVRDLFKVKYGVNLELINCIETTKDDPDGIAFVSRTADNNGVSAYVKRVDDVTPQPARTITVAGGGSVLSTFLQPRPFYSGRDLYVLYPKDDMSDAAKLFIIAVIKANQFRYAYGRQANTTLPFIKLMLPAANNRPDYEWMEAYIHSLHSKPITTRSGMKRLPLNTSDWKPFRIGDFFAVHPTRAVKDLSSKDFINTGCPVVVNSAVNNGVGGYIDMDATEDGSIITFSDTTDGNTFFYQPGPFIGFAHVQGMYPKDLNISTAAMQFICAMLTFDARGRYTYGRKMRRDTIMEVKIKLPATPSGTPDWQWMENYIKSLPYGDRI